MENSSAGACGGPPDPAAAPPRRRGRRPGPSSTRGAIVAATRQTLAERGLDGTTTRRVAALAGVDPALVRHYFDSKTELAEAALQPPFDPAAELATALSGPADGRGTRVVATFLRAWDPPQARQILHATLHSVAGDSAAARRLSGYVSRAFIEPMAATATGPDRQLRANLAHAQLVGLAMERYVLQVEPVASSDADQVARLVGPALDHLLR